MFPFISVCFYPSVLCDVMCFALFYQQNSILHVHQSFVKSLQSFSVTFCPTGLICRPEAMQLNLSLQHTCKYNGKKHGSNAWDAKFYKWELSKKLISITAHDRLHSLLCTEEQVVNMNLVYLGSLSGKFQNLNISWWKHIWNSFLFP